MSRSLQTLTLLAVAAVWSRVPADEPPDSPDAIRPADVIEAREELMVAAETLMQPIDTYTVDDSVDTDLMRTNANAISAMLLAVPHLFPASTNLYDPDVKLPETLALPSVWQSFASFYQLASAASTAAEELIESPDGDELRAASLALRASCDACHAVYLLPYESPSVTEEDLDFDFDSVFDDN